MKILKATLAMLVIVSMVGCATRGVNYEPLVDLKGKSTSQFGQDLGECKAYAQQANDAASTAVAGAIVVGLLAAFLATRGDRNYYAGRGAVLGGAAGGAHAVDTQETIIKKCLAGRGYNVLN